MRMTRRLDSNISSIGSYITVHFFNYGTNDADVSMPMTTESVWKRNILNDDVQAANCQLDRANACSNLLTYSQSLKHA